MYVCVVLTHLLFNLWCWQHVYMYIHMNVCLCRVAFRCIHCGKYGPALYVFLIDNVCMCIVTLARFTMPASQSKDQTNAQMHPV